MKYVFIGVPGEDHEGVLMYGVEMPLGEAVEVSDLAARKLKNHPHFKAEASQEESAAEQDEPMRKKPGRPRRDA